MPRCLHIYESGIQCLDDSMEQGEFCESHQKVVEFETLVDSPGRKFFIRVVALLLLLLFLIPFYFTVRGIYFGPPARGEEVW